LDRARRFEGHAGQSAGDLSSSSRRHRTVLAGPPSQSLRQTLCAAVQTAARGTLGLRMGAPRLGRTESESAPLAVLIGTPGTGPDLSFMLRCRWLPSDVSEPAARRRLVPRGLFCPQSLTWRPRVLRPATRPWSHPLPSSAHPREPARRHPPRLPANPHPVRRAPRMAHRTRKSQPCSLTRFPWWDVWPMGDRSAKAGAARSFRPPPRLSGGPFHSREDSRSRKHLAADPWTPSPSRLRSASIG
jgi:hypothetical protein